MRYRNNEKRNEKVYCDDRITVQRDERNKTNGWGSVAKVWCENADDDGEHELNMTARQLSIPIGEVAVTLIV